jgi:hypothetical protein
MPRRDSNPQSQESSGQAFVLDGAATGIGRIESATFRLVVQSLNQLRHHEPQKCVEAG